MYNYRIAEFNFELPNVGVVLDLTGAPIKTNELLHDTYTDTYGTLWIRYNKHSERYYDYYVVTPVVTEPFMQSAESFTPISKLLCRMTPTPILSDVGTNPFGIEESIKKYCAENIICTDFFMCQDSPYSGKNSLIPYEVTSIMDI